MTVLVTGGAGYIGSHMVLGLLEKGEKVVVIDNLSTGFDWAVPTEAQLFIGDIADKKLIKNIITENNVKAIIHFAGSIVVPESITDPLGYYLNNTVKSRDLIECAVSEQVNHFIFSSTAAVYGSPKTNPVYEDSPLMPVSPYGTSKMMTEMMLRDISNVTDFNYIALRYFNVAGADPQSRTGQSTPKATHLIKVASEIIHGDRQEMNIFGTDYPTKDGTCIRDYVHVCDLANAHCLALDYLREGGKSNVFNCGYGHGFSVREVIDTVKSVSNKDFPVHEVERRPGDPAELIAGSDIIGEKLGWQPQYDDLSTIVKHALSWEDKLNQIKTSH